MSFTDVHTKEQKEIDRRVLARVRKGIELLKKNYGDDFADYIDMEALKLSSGANCMLGQMHTHRTGDKPFEEAYWEEKNFLGISEEEAQSCGFNLGLLDKLGGYRELENAWMQELAMMNE